jgi:CRP-like cAMP-binding protein
MRQTEVLFIEISDFRRVAEEQPEAWRHLSLLVLENLGQTIGLAQDLMVRSGRQRLRAILARLAGLHAELVPDPPIIYATQAEVADIANLARSVVSRFLQEMERDGILRPGWGTIEILNPQRLMRGTEASN